MSAFAPAGAPEKLIESWRSGADDVESPAGARFVMGVPAALRGDGRRDNPPPPTIVTCGGAGCQVSEVEAYGCVV